MKKNYYLILGVSATATLGEIKSAFRRRAKEWHPDHSGGESGPFLDIQEAYDVLSDPERRRSYDRNSNSAARRTPWGRSPEPLVRQRSEAETFRQAEHESCTGEFSFSESLDVYRPSFEEIFERLWSNFQEWPRPKADRVENITFEALLTPLEALSGGLIRLWIPGLAACPACNGRGVVGSYECRRCRGKGALAGDYPVDIEYPPGIRDGRIVRVSLTRFGIENLYLTVIFLIDGNQPKNECSENNGNA